jgi:hypothetical protein
MHFDAGGAKPPGVEIPPPVDADDLDAVLAQR